MNNDKSLFQHQIHHVDRSLQNSIRQFCMIRKVKSNGVLKWYICMKCMPRFEKFLCNKNNKNWHILLKSFKSYQTEKNVFWFINSIKSLLWLLIPQVLSSIQYILFQGHIKGVAKNLNYIWQTDKSFILPLLLWYKPHHSNFKHKDVQYDCHFLRFLPK